MESHALQHHKLQNTHTPVFAVRTMPNDPKLRPVLGCIRDDVPSSHFSIVCLSVSILSEFVLTSIVDGALATTLVGFGASACNCNRKWHALLVALDRKNSSGAMS